MSKIIIQLLGQARSGKDFTASQLKCYYESIGMKVEILSYAAPMKQIAATLFNISLEKLDDLKNRPTETGIEPYDDGSVFNSLETITFRTFLQRLGNEAIKPIFGDDVWANLAQKSIDNSDADVIITSDCRFLVELKQIGGYTVRIINNSLEEPMNHASELELANEQTMFQLDNTNYSSTYGDVVKIANKILNKHKELL